MGLTALRVNENVMGRAHQFPGYGLGAPLFRQAISKRSPQQTQMANIMNPNEPTHFSSEGIFKEEPVPDETGPFTPFTHETRAALLIQFKEEFTRAGWKEWNQKVNEPFRHYSGSNVLIAEREIPGYHSSRIELFTSKESASCSITFRYIRVIDGKQFHQRDIMHFHFVNPSNPGKIHGVVQRGTPEAFWRPFFFLTSPTVAMPYILTMLRQSCGFYNECAARSPITVERGSSEMLKSLLFRPQRYESLLRQRLTVLGWTNWTTKQKKKETRLTASMKGEKNDSITITNSKNSLKCHAILNYTERRAGRLHGLQDTLIVTFTANQLAEVWLEQGVERASVNWYAFPIAFKTFMKAMVVSHTAYTDRPAQRITSKSKVRGATVE